MRQNALFFDTVYDAIGSDIIDAGGYNKVAGTLWPNMKVASAYARLKACVDEHKDEKLDPEETLAVAKMAKAATGSSNYLRYIGHELSCEYTDVEPEDELTKLLRVYLDREKEQDQIKSRIDENIVKLRSVR